MPQETRNQKLASLLYAVGAIVIGLGVLFFSMARATLEITAQENDEDKYRNNPIDFIVTYSDGTTEPYTYKLPGARTLPSHPAYGLKELRDTIWLALSIKPINKSKIALLIADKKISEAAILFNNNRPKSALKASKEALDKLKYSDKVLGDDLTNDPQNLQLHSQIFTAGFAYKEIINNAKEVFDMDLGKYEEISRELDRFNTTQKDKKEAMRF